MKAIENHLYQHFKGNTYIVLQIGQHTETGEEMVVYQEWIAQQPRGAVYIRPRLMFEQRISENIPRFAHIGYAYPMPESPDEF